MYELYDEVIINKSNTKGTIVDIRNIQGVRYTVESNEKLAGVDSNSYPIFDCSESEISKI